MEDNLEKKISIEEQRIKNLIEAYHGGLIKADEERLESIREQMSETDKKLKDLLDEEKRIRRKNISELNEEEKSRLESIEQEIKLQKERSSELDSERKAEEKSLKEHTKAKEAAMEGLHAQAVKNVFDEDKLKLNMLEKYHKEEMLFEEEHRKAIEDSLSAQTEEEQEAAKKRLDAIEKEISAHKRKGEQIKKESEIQEKKNAQLNKSLALHKADLKSRAEAYKIDAQMKRDRAEQLEKEKEEKLAAGTMTHPELKIYNKQITKLNNQAAMDDWMAQMPQMIGKAVANGMTNLNNAVDAAIQDVVSHRTKIMARLQGLGGEDEYDYNGLLNLTKSQLATSPFVKQQDFLAKLDAAVEKGIAYNVEQRTFLATISDKIATTFDAFDSNLLRLIKLQQADSTAARLGMEASLTKTLNSVFSDTSYLTDKVYENVRSAIVDTESIMSREASTEFEYTVQKWMGSLYSLGFSSDTITEIVKGINYLGTGDVAALAGDSSLQTLLAMSASRSGQDYAQLLTEGLNASNVNSLLKSMVEYLREIAVDSKNNNVVKSAYGDLLNLSMSDFRAISSLTDTDISNLYSQNLDYGGATRELNSQLQSITQRMSMSEMIHNVMDNFVYTLGEGIAENAVTYVMWEVTDLIENATGGIHLPAIEVFGNMVDLSSFTIEGIVKTGIVGLSTLAQIGTILGSITGGGGLNLAAWGGTDILERGQNISMSTGFSNTTSSSTYVGNSSSQDVKNSSIAGQTEEAEDVEQITNEGREPDHTFDDFYENVFINEIPITVKEAGEYTTSDIYKSLFITKIPVVVALDQESGLGAALALLAANITNQNRVVNVNLKSSDITLKSSLESVMPNVSESFRTFLKGAFSSALSEEIKKTVIGGDTSDGDTIQRVCTKILNDSVDTMVKNNYFDEALSKYVTFGV